jgi:hypothetical protein
MIQDVDETLRRLLAAELKKLPGCPVQEKEQITFDAPAAAEALQDGEARVNLFLHDIRENREARHEAQRLMREPTGEAPSARAQALREAGAVRQWTRMYLDLGYLVTVYAGDSPGTEHWLLAEVLRVLLRYQAAPEKYLFGGLESLGSNALCLAVAQPDQTTYADPPALWQALGGRLRPSLGLVATAPIDPYEPPTKWTPVVREAVFGAVRSMGGSEAADPYGLPSLPAVRVCAAGVVFDEASRQPLAGVEVTVEGSDRVLAPEGSVPTVQTDAQGVFYLLNLPAGTCHLLFRRRGYRERGGGEERLPVEVPPPGQPNRLQTLEVAMCPLGEEERVNEAAERATLIRNAPDLVEAGRTSALSLKGRLCWPNDRPAVSVPVRVGHRYASTDSDGVYCFFNLKEGERCAFAVVPGHGEIALSPPQGMDGGTQVVPFPPSRTATAAPPPSAEPTVAPPTDRSTGRDSKAD